MCRVEGEARGGEGSRATNEPPDEIVDSVRVEQLLHRGQPELRNVDYGRLRVSRGDSGHDAAVFGCGEVNKRELTRRGIRD